ncbi:MAG: ribosome biogenesis GTPase Der [Clostridia bacterium]|nr:ribosome biogenesis GTPase Der [Clostridia bacterium]
MNNRLVAVVGRPNVGKSTFFNRVAGKRISITLDMPGVTRDRIYADCEWCGHTFTMIDTGGIEIKSEDTMWKHIRRQAEIAVDIADVIVFVVDGKQGIVNDDFRIATLLRHTRKPVILAVNKLDNPHDHPYDFYELGLGEPYGVSAEHNKGVADVLDAVVDSFKQIDATETDSEEGLKIAVVGKPNAGKSSLVNKLLGSERTIVSDIAGTTRDSIDSVLRLNGKTYTLIDTAGMRKQKAVDEDVEYYSVMRALASVRRADVVLIVIDAQMGITEQDIKIAGYVHEQGKPSVIVMNKWDTIEKDTHTILQFDKTLANSLKFMEYYRAVYVSALTGKRVEKILNEAELVYANNCRRISTGTLNDVIADLLAVNEPPTKNGRRLKIYYTTQTDVCQPTFVMFVNDETLMHFSYRRYIENGLRKAFDFSGTPIKLVLRNKTDQDAL